MRRAAPNCWRAWGSPAPTRRSSTSATPATGRRWLGSSRASCWGGPTRASTTAPWSTGPPIRRGRPSPARWPRSSDWAILHTMSSAQSLQRPDWRVALPALLLLGGRGAYIAGAVVGTLGWLVLVGGARWLVVHTPPS